MFLDDRRGLPDDFWDMTTDDVQAVLASITRNAEREQAVRKDDAKVQAVMLRNASLQAADAISIMFSKTPRELHGIEEYYPHLFKEEVELDEETAKRRFLAFCDDVNAYRRAQRALQEGKEGVANAG